jgi:hypothetical protein
MPSCSYGNCQGVIADRSANTVGEPIIVFDAGSLAEQVDRRHAVQYVQLDSFIETKLDLSACHNQTDSSTPSVLRESSSDVGFNTVENNYDVISRRKALVKSLPFPLLGKKSNFSNVEVSGHLVCQVLR